MKISSHQLPKNLPGGDIILPGFDDLESNKETIASLLISIASQNIMRAGVQVSRVIPDPEIKLYQILCDEFGNRAHSKFNSLIRLLISFEKSLKCVT